MNDKLKSYIKRFYNEFGIDHCVICAIEECSEVTQVMTKYQRKSHKFSTEKLTEELAHSLLMLETIKDKFMIEQEDIDNQQLLALRKLFKEI